jgi:DNA repair protein RadC
MADTPKADLRAKALAKTGPRAEALAKAGHRERLKHRFMDGHGKGLADYELLELALTFAIPRKDVKPLAKDLLARFGDLAGVTAAAPEALAKVRGLGASSVAYLKLLHALALRTRRAHVADKPLLGNRLALLDYLYTLYKGKTREEVHVLYLDAQLQLVADETLFTGTLTASAASPRDIIKRALELNAAGFVIAHNHPSGAPRPSADDTEFTARLLQLCPAMDLTLHDHLIIGEGRHFSFKGAGQL